MAHARRERFLPGPRSGSMAVIAAARLRISNQVKLCFVRCSSSPSSPLYS
jgi:hypothetical protein